MQSKERPILQKVFKKLSLHHGLQRWWPGDTPFEVAVGAILVQHTSWKNAERAVRFLKEKELLGITALSEEPLEEIRRAVTHRTCESESRETQMLCPVPMYTF